MKKLLSLFLLPLGFSSLHQTTTAQVAISSATTYTQNFDSLGTADVAWTDNTTLPGWFIVKETNAVTTLPASDGSDGASEVYNYGVAADPDRSLGSIASLNESAFYGVRFTNSSAFFTITNIVVTYDGEQWRKGNLNATPSSLQFFFRVGGTDFLADTNNAGWTAVSALDFASPQSFAGVVQTLNGNDTTNRVAGITANIPVNVPPGQEVWLRWYDEDDASAGGDHGLSIDNLSVQFQTSGGIVAFIPLNATVELKKPKLTKPLRFKGANGFPFKALIKTAGTVSNVSYFAFGGTNQPTNATFTTAGLLKEFKKGKKFKQGYKYMAKHKGKSNKPGIGIAAGATPVNLTVRVQGSNNGTNSATLFTNFVFNDVTVK